MNRPQDSHDFPLPLKGVREEGTVASIQTREQKKAEAIAWELAGEYGEHIGMSRRQFLRTAGGMAISFMAMNSVFGNLFFVDPAEAADPVFAQARKNAFAGQFIFDVQTHFVSPWYESESMLGLRKMAKKWNSELKDEEDDLDKIRFDNYYREIYEKSDTKLAVLSSAPHDDPKKWFIHNDEMASTRKSVNRRAGRKILYSHAIFSPGSPGWMEELERSIDVYKPDAWKGYTTGTPFEHSKYPWRLDDERLVYRAYEKMVKAGIRNVCIHKGLLPALYKTKMRNNWQYDKVDDVAKAAKDWPQLNFIIYHSGLKMGKPPSDDDLRDYEKSGYIPWVSDLAAIPEKHGVKNVYAEIGSSFALTAISKPRYCAGMLGTLIKGFGPEKVLWGTDSVFYGSPQWQIEALRRIQMPPDLQRKFGYPALGRENSETKSMIFGRNAAKLHKVKM